MNDVQRAEFLRVMAFFPNATAACRAAGVKRTDAYEERDRSPDFAAAWAAARDSALDLYEQIVKERALG